MSVVDDIKSRLDIVETVSSYAALKRSGKYLKALCPFHTEKTPSFIVSPERQSWRCFGACATGGDVLSFVSRAERLDFGDTLRLLAQRTGVELSDRPDRDRSEPLYRVNQLAGRFYVDALSEAQGRHALEYLEGRGVTEEAQKRFELGFSPRRRDALKSHLLALGISEDEAVRAGVLHQDDDGGTRDFFRAAADVSDTRQAGTGRGLRRQGLDDSNPKYLNTPATSIFDKRGTLYGMHLAAEAIRSGRSGVIVEGYMDTIAAHQFGYRNVVASMGTALTEQQVAQLKPMAPSFVLALDPDAAGQEATLRSLESAWHQIGQRRSAVMNSSVGVLHQREPVSIGIAALPEGKDPDDLIRNDAPRVEAADFRGRTSSRFFDPDSRRPVRREHRAGKGAGTRGAGTAHRGRRADRTGRVHRQAGQSDRRGRQGRQSEYRRAAQAWGEAWGTRSRYRAIRRRRDGDSACPVRRLGRGLYALFASEEAGVERDDRRLQRRKFPSKRIPRGIYALAKLPYNR